MRDIMLAINDGGSTTLWRNSVGVAENWNPRTGKTTHSRQGLGTGSSDLIGCSYGVFLAIEVKSAKGFASDEQERFLRHVRRIGGVSGVARSVDDARSLVEECRVKMNGKGQGK